MFNIEFEKVNINKFWDKTPNPLKYILIFTILAATLYFVVSKKLDDSSVKELQSIKKGVDVTYQLLDNFDNFRKEQDIYNKEVLNYLKNLHTLVEELNENTNRKFNMILNSGSKNTEDIVEKIVILNESFEKISKVYQSDLQVPQPQTKPTRTTNINVYDEDGNLINTKKLK